MRLRSEPMLRRCRQSQANGVMTHCTLMLPSCLHYTHSFANAETQVAQYTVRNVDLSVV